MEAIKCGELYEEDVDHAELVYEILRLKDSLGKILRALNISPNYEDRKLEQKILLRHPDLK